MTPALVRNNIICIYIFKDHPSTEALTYSEDRPCHETTLKN
jgi:hypothetical protein